MNFVTYLFSLIFCFSCFYLQGNDVVTEYELLEDAFWDFSNKIQDINEKSVFENVSIALFQKARNNKIEWNEWEQNCKYLYHLFNEDKCSEFQKNEYVIFEIPDSLNDAIIECCNSSRRVWLTSENYASEYSTNPPEIIKTFFGKFPHLFTSNKMISIVNECINYFYDKIASELGFHWKVLNIRPTILEQNNLLKNWNWHKDGFPIPVRKIMIYPMGVGEENGGIQFRSNKDGSIIIPSCDKGALLLFENSKLLHSAFPPQSNLNRMALELIIIPMPYPYSKTTICGLNGRYLPRPDFSLVQKTQYEKNIRGINIGGGNTRTPPHWKNLDELSNFKLHSGVEFPIISNTLEIAYSSHCLEHLCDATLFRILEETKRCLKSGGDFVIKIPDFEGVLENLKNKNSVFFKKWNIETFLSGWNRWGIRDSIEARAAFIFCSIYSHNPFVKPHQWDKKTMYYGPAPLSQKEYSSILFSNHSISEITHQFMLNILSNPKISITNFSHQNAWSRLELADLLSSFEFEIISFDRNRICSQFPWIPGIKEMFDVSLYCWVKKK